MQDLFKRDVLLLDAGNDAAPAQKKLLSEGGKGGGEGGGGDSDTFLVPPQKIKSISQTRGRGILLHDWPLWQASEHTKKVAKRGCLTPSPPHTLCIHVCQGMLCVSN